MSPSVKENDIDLSECLYSWKQDCIFSSIKKKKSVALLVNYVLVVQRLTIGS